jgi:hypothetical protein
MNELSQTMMPSLNDQRQGCHIGIASQGLKCWGVGWQQMLCVGTVQPVQRSAVAPSRFQGSREAVASD